MYVNVCVGVCESVMCCEQMQCGAYLCLSVLCVCMCVSVCQCGVGVSVTGTEGGQGVGWGNSHISQQFMEVSPGTCLSPTPWKGDTWRAVISDKMGVNTGCPHSHLPSSLWSHKALFSPLPTKAFSQQQSLGEVL